MTDARSVIDTFGTRWAAHDLEGTVALITEDCVFEATGPSPDGTRCVGATEIRAAWLPIFENTDSVFTVEDTIESGDRVVQLWTYSWGDGHVRGVDVFRIRDGKVAEKFSYVKG
jgi:ketosteroid isomerase-like protein